MDRRTFLKGLVATAAGILVPASVAAEPERRVWALDRTMVKPQHDWTAHNQPLLAGGEWQSGWFGTQYWDTEEHAMMTWTKAGWERQYISAELRDRATGDTWVEPLVAQLDGSYGCTVGRECDVVQVNVLAIPTHPSAFTITIRS